MNAIRISALVAACLAGGGCFYKTPTFTVVDVGMEAESEEAIVVSFTLEGVNDNAVALPLGRTRYALQVDGRQVFRGVRSAEATLPRRGHQRIDVPVVIPASVLDELGGDLLAYRLSGHVEYQLPGALGELIFETDLRRPKAPFAERGRLDLGDVIVREVIVEEIDVDEEPPAPPPPEAPLPSPDEAAPPQPPGEG